VTEDSINLIKELNNYSWLEKKSKTPIDKHNHLIDAIRMAVSYQLQNPNRGKYYIQ
jgi:phage terminase large subunit